MVSDRYSTEHKRRELNTKIKLYTHLWSFLCKKLPVTSFGLKFNRKFFWSDLSLCARNKHCEENWRPNYQNWQTSTCMLNDLRSTLHYFYDIYSYISQTIKMNLIPTRHITECNSILKWDLDWFVNVKFWSTYFLSVHIGIRRCTSLQRVPVHTWFRLQGLVSLRDLKTISKPA